MNKTNIPWCDVSWNPITGCTNVCEYCYARKLTERFPAAYPNGFEPTFCPDRLSEPRKMKTPSVIFVGSMGDLFDLAFTDEQIVDVLLGVAECAAPLHTYMVLTKHSRRACEYVKKHGLPVQVWMGVSITHSHELHRLNDLRRAAPYGLHHNFVSLEPMLSPIRADYSRLDLVVVGSKKPGRPLHETHPDWLDGVIADCEAAGVPLHYKHGGRNPEYKGRVYDWRPTV
jgi:protein gp37